MMKRIALMLIFSLIVPLNSAFAKSSENAEQRLSFLRDRLEASRTHGMWWQWGWFAVSAGGTGFNTVYSVNKEGSERTGYVVEAAKSGIGVIYLAVKPMQARHGADRIPDEVPLEEQVRIAERLLKANAHRAKERTSLLMYAGNTFLEGAGLGVTLAWGEKDDAWINFAIGMVAGSLQIWSQPKRPLTDWQEYQAQFEGTPVKETKWWISPSPDLRGLAFNYKW